MNDDEMVNVADDTDDRQINEGEVREGVRQQEGGRLGIFVTTNDESSQYIPLSINPWRERQYTRTRQCATLESQDDNRRYTTGASRSTTSGEKEGKQDGKVVHMEDIDTSPQRGPRVWYLVDDMSDLKLGRLWEDDKCWENACEYKEEAVERNQSRCREKELEDKQRQESGVDEQHNTTADSSSSTTADKERKQEVYMENTDPRRDTAAAHKIGRSRDSGRYAYEYKGETGERNHRSCTREALDELRNKEKVFPEEEREEWRGETTNLTTLDSKQRGGAVETIKEPSGRTLRTRGRSRTSADEDVRIPVRARPVQANMRTYLVATELTPPSTAYL
eukprot:gene34748-44939_t